jgi:hypothetical protein
MWRMKSHSLTIRVGCACAAEARWQSLLVAQSPEEAKIQAFIDSVDQWPDAETSQ